MSQETETFELGGPAAIVHAVIRRLTFLALAAVAAIPADAAVPTTVTLHEPVPRTYAIHLPAAGPDGFLEATEPRSGQRIEFGNRVLIRVHSANDLAGVLDRIQQPAVRRADDRSIVVAFPSATEAVLASAQLASDPAVEAASPSRRRFNAAPHANWGGAPNDPFYPKQWHLEPSRGVLGAVPGSSGFEMRAVWPVSQGAGVTIAFVDNGLDATHPDLQEAFVPSLARNWFTLATNCAHASQSAYHGTAVAGLAAARGNNAIGITGVAPRVRLTGWVIFDAANNLPETENLATAFEYRPDAIRLQNHSWGNADIDFLYSTLVERIALSNATFHAHGGRGTIMVRSAGNTRTKSVGGIQGVGDANLDAFGNEPGAITVAGLRRDGAVASYSAPGACLLLAAPGGEVAEGTRLFTLDPVGRAGQSTGDYLPEFHNFVGTSFAAPLISGLVALVLDVQPGIALPELQRLLVLSSWPLDSADPDLATNRAGLAFSHNVGFGTPDPALLLDLARRPGFTQPAAARLEVRIRQTNDLPIPDDGLHVVVNGPGLGSGRTFPASPGTGLHPDSPTRDFPIVDAGPVGGSIVAPIAGAAALLQRSTDSFADQIRLAANAGAACAVILNNNSINPSARSVMLATESARIPAVQVGFADGTTLRTIAATNPAATVRLELDSALIPFEVTNALSLDWVQVRVRIVHPRTGDLRVTLRSPTGTLSVLHRAGTLQSAMIEEWWYSSKRHLFESSAGTWTLAVTDQAAGQTGIVAETELILHGIPITDTDRDGLDDDWERREIGSLAASGADDPDRDGWSHAAEAWLGQSPLISDRPLFASIARADNARFRITWPSRSNRRYRLERAVDPAGPWSSLGEAGFPGLTGSWFLPESASTEFLRILESQ